jgi:hypothetical protein
MTTGKGVAWALLYILADWCLVLRSILMQGLQSVQWRGCLNEREESTVQL